MSQLRARLRGREDGSAMVMVIGIMMVGAIITTTLAVVTMYNTRFAVENKQAMQALQSADAGIDITLQLLEGKRYNELGTVCGDDYTINDDDVEVTLEYTLSNNAVTPCPTSSQIVKSVRIISAATTAASILGGDETTRTSVATLRPQPPQVVLDKAVFTEGSTTITNNSEFEASGATDSDGNPEMDAHIYSNGGIECATQNEIQGQIIAAHGPVTFPNNCKIYSDVWSSDYVFFKTGAHVYGNVYAASAREAVWNDRNGQNGTGGIHFRNNGYVTGAILTNGGILTGAKQQSESGVYGSAFARTGQVLFENDAYIGGSVYAGRGVDLGNGSRIGGDVVAGVTTRPDGSITGRGYVGRHATVTGTVGSQVAVSGTTTQGQSSTAFPAAVYPAKQDPSSIFPSGVGYPNTIQPPPREQMPVLTMGPDDIQLWRDAGYQSVEIYDQPNDCTGDNPRNILNGSGRVAVTPGTARLIMFTACTNPVTFTNQVNISLTSSVAMVSKTGFRTENKFHVTTNAPSGAMYQMHWIVPADSPNVTWVPANSGQTSPVCNPTNTGNIEFRNDVKINTVETLAYTPCHFYQQNAWQDPWIGQIYAGSVTLQNNFKLKMTTVSVPSLSDSEPDPTSLAEMLMVARFDDYS